MKHFIPSIEEGVEDFYTMESRTPEEVLLDAQAALAAVGVEMDFSPLRPAGAILVAEAVNWAAKTINPSFYDIKPGVVDAAVQIGCEGGWYNGVYYLHHEDVGTASFHDPYSQITAQGHWPHGWCGIRRQDMAFEIASNATIRRLYAEATSPKGRLAGLREASLYKILKRVA